MDRVDYSEQDQLDEIKSRITDEMTYRLYVLNTFHDLQVKLKYQEKLLESHVIDLAAIDTNITQLLQEHKVCTAHVAESLTYKDTWVWTKNVKETLMTAVRKFTVWFLLIAVAFLLFMYLTHVPRPTLPPVQPPQQGGVDGGG